MGVGRHGVADAAPLGPLNILCAVADPSQRDPESIARRDAIKVIKEDERWSATVVPVGAGVLVANKLT